MKITIDKTVKEILRTKPETFKGTKFEWKKLIKSILIQPEQGVEWSKNQKTGEWEAIRIK